MGWFYKDSLGGFDTPTQYLDDQFTGPGEDHDYRVLRSSLVKMRRYYAAVEQTSRISGERRVSALLCLVDYNPRSRNGHVFGYRSMGEESGPYEYDCPAAILDMLTPTDSEYARIWRQKCRARLEKVRPKSGQVLVLAEPLKYADGLRSRFTVVKSQTGRRRELRFVGEDGGFYRIPKLLDREFTLETPVLHKTPPPQQALLFA